MVDKVRWLGAVGTYFTKNRKGELTQSEIKLLLDYTISIWDLIEKIKTEGFLKQIREQELAEVGKRLFRIHNAVGSLQNVMMRYVTNVNDTSKVLKDSKGNEYAFEPETIMMPTLWGYVTHLELTVAILKEVFDIERINASLAKPISLRGRLTIDPVKKVLENYSGTDLFRDVDTELRNAISHYEFDFIRRGPNSLLIYRDCEMQLGDAMIASKKANILFTAVILTILHMKKVNPFLMM